MRPSTATAADYARTEPPAPATPWRDAGYCVVDLETTGLDARHHEIISYAAIPIDEARVRPGGLVSGLVRPRHMPRADSMRIHGLRPTDLAGAPALHEALDHLLGALSGRALVAHVAWVEEGFLSRALRAHGVRLYDAPIDTAGLADVVFGRRPGGDPLRLSAVAAHLGLPVHRPHHAEGDALTTAQVFIALATRLERVSGPQTVRSLTLTSRRLRRMRLRH